MWRKKWKLTVAIHLNFDTVLKDGKPIRNDLNLGFPFDSPTRYEMISKYFPSAKIRVRASRLWIFAVFLMPSPAAAAEGEKVYGKEIEPILIEYCFDCHGDGMDKGDFAMDEYQSLSSHLKDLDVWYEIWKNVRANLMPPPKKTQLPDKEKKKVLRFIVDHVFRIDPDNPDPGRVTVRRLNRQEYRHTVKDILGVNFPVNDFFPPDDTGYGFDTIGDVLSISPLLMDKYIEAAAEIAAKAVPVSGPQIVTWWLPIGEFKGKESSSHKLSYLPFESQRQLESKPWVEFDGEYEVSLHYRIGGSREATEETASLSFWLDGKKKIERPVAWDKRNEIVAKTKVRLKRGSEHLFAVAMSPGRKRDPDEKKLYAAVESIRLRGPLDGSQPDYPWEFRKIFSEGPPPDSQDQRDSYREKILHRLALRLFRRPPEKELIDRLVKLARRIDEEPGKRFEHGIRHAVTAMLASPRFLMRLEVQPDPNDPNRIELLDEYALASRLSYFLWLSAPDAKLLELAGKKELRKNLRSEINRLLGDKKSERFIESFVGQWLQARDVETVFVDERAALREPSLTKARRAFSGNLRRAMRMETEMFFRHILMEKRPATELLTANYAFLNEDLANWYEIGGVKGREMRRVDLKKNTRRGGILKQATFQIVTSNPNRTSPVKRGLFVLENLLATPPPSAAPDVPPLEQTLSGKNRNLPLRDALNLHSKDPMCASCHARMDPIGFALENYNFAGMWIEKYRGQPIDSSGKLVTGETFHNAHELSVILATKRKREFLTALTEKLFTFAVGRGVEFYDAATIDSVVDRSINEGGTLREILYRVIESPAFQKRRGDSGILSKGEV